MVHADRHERLCRLWLLIIAILHWIVFGLLVRSSEQAELVPATGRTLASLLNTYFTGA